MNKLLLEIKDVASAIQPDRDCLLPVQNTNFETRFDTIVATGFQANSILEQLEPLPTKYGKSKQHPDKNLVDYFAA